MCTPHPDGHDGRVVGPLNTDVDHLPAPVHRGRPRSTRRGWSTRPWARRERDGNGGRGGRCSRQRGRVWTAHTAHSRGAQ